MNDKARLTLTPDDVREVLRHCHWIAMKNGAADLFVSRNYPGYALSNLVDTLKRGGALAGDKQHFAGLRPRKDLVLFEVLHGGALVATLRRKSGDVRRTTLPIVRI